MDLPLLPRAAASRSCCSYRTLKAWLPILSWLPSYNLKWLQMDLLAGLTVGLTTVPQALAYAEVAGLPVQVNSCWVSCEGSSFGFKMFTFVSYVQKSAELVYFCLQCNNNEHNRCNSLII